ncbi:MAG TPA: hypothetical protein PKZ76_00335 [Xanthomonadaceae bacterium]|nr:hypothetical protein [Xanthomonadaceae bacterium]
MRSICLPATLLGLALSPTPAGALPVCEFDLQPPSNLGDRGCFIEIGPNELAPAPHVLTIDIAPEGDEYLVNFIIDVQNLVTRDPDVWFSVFELETFDATQNIDRIFQVEVNHHESGQPRIRMRHLKMHDSGIHSELVQETTLGAVDPCTRILGHWSRGGPRADRPGLRLSVASVDSDNDHDDDCAVAEDGLPAQVVMQAPRIGEPLRLSFGRLGVTGNVATLDNRKGYLYLFDPYDWD